MSDDTISRQAAIDEIIDSFECGDYLQETLRRLKDLPSAQPQKVCVAEIKVEIDDIKDYIDKAINAERWIPCSERLPEDSGWYIVTKNLAYDTTWVGLEWYNHENGWKYDDGKCIAWMPLPEPYKGEQE